METDDDPAGDGLVWNSMTLHRAFDLCRDPSSGFEREAESIVLIRF